jgi:hypothetical protein
MPLYKVILTTKTRDALSKDELDDAACKPAWGEYKRLYEQFRETNPTPISESSISIRLINLKVVKADGLTGAGRAAGVTTTTAAPRSLLLPTTGGRGGPPPPPLPGAPRRGDGGGGSVPPPPPPMP